MELKSINIDKSYKGIKVVKGVSLSLKKGEIVGLLGPNGAGKTTTFDMIVGLISPVYISIKSVQMLLLILIELSIISHN